jgi:hypothetical protein
MDDAERRDEMTGRLKPAPDPDVVFDIETIDGPDGEHMAEQQARVMKEVIEWLARNRFERGHDNAA